MTGFNRHAIVLLLGAACVSTAALAEDPTISVYKSPTCTCCGKWIAHLQQEGCYRRRDRVQESPA
jgi:hypothetical protein